MHKSLWFASEDIDQVSDTQVMQDITFTLEQHGYTELEPLVLPHLRRFTQTILPCLVSRSYLAEDVSVFVRRNSDGFVGRILRLAVWYGSFNDPDFSVHFQRNENFESTFSPLPFTPSQHQQ